MARIHNFNPGPSALPLEVLERMKADLPDYKGTGMSVLEISHRSPEFTKINDTVESLLREMMGIPDNYRVILMGGGASLQFAMIPMNFMPENGSADYLDTGVWTTKAIKEAKKFGRVNVAFEGAATSYDHAPSADEISLDSNAAYVHYCSNNTIYGTRFDQPPATSKPLIADTSSEMFSRPIDVNRHALIYAGAQKNLGPSGTTLVIAQRDFIATGRENLPTMLDYRKHADKGSRLNTPPTFGIYIMGLVFRWILDQGGLEAMQRSNEAKAKIVYDAIDGSGGFYKAVARADSRSLMNIPFRTPSDDLDKAFLAESANNDMSGLKGHRDVDGLRASIYNAFPKAGCVALAEFMKDFASRNG
jgi:phosphoserine aminotransferase